MEERNKRKFAEIEERGPEFFVYTSETKDADIPKETLTHLRVDSSVTEIPDEAFNRCAALVQVQVPETLTRIGKGAFDGCSKLKRFQFVSHASSFEIISSSPNLEDGLILFPENAKLQLDEGAFDSCYSLRKVIVRSVSTKLSEAVFANCRGLMSVELPEGLRVIEISLFSGCSSLTTVQIPSSVTQIRKHAFSGCPSLSFFDLPYGLLEIGESSFSGCETIKTLHIPATVTTIGARAFKLCSGLMHIELSPTLERIETCTFQKCGGLEHIDLPSTVSFIGHCAFGNCRKMKSIKLPPALERIEGYAFFECVVLESIEIPSTVSFIGKNAFWSCCSLSHVRIPPSVDCRMDWAFGGCSVLVSIEAPEGLTIIETQRMYYHAGLGCPSLVNLAIPTLNASLEGYKYLRDSKLGSIVDSNADLAHRLKHRFDTCPLNKLCYYQSYYPLEAAMVQLHGLLKDDPLAATNQVDEFGMTSLHILSLSQTPKLELLLTVLKRGQADHILHGKDSFGSTPMDYLCLNRMPSSTNVIRSVMKSRFSYVLSLDPLFESDMLQAVDEALAVDLSSRRREIGRVYFQLANYERKESITLVELYLWKIKIDDEVSTNKQTANRHFCRFNCGASFVIPHVIAFLDEIDAEDYFVPLISSDDSEGSYASYDNGEGYLFFPPINW
eukprot:scaffold1228_cov119-Cylindrotheca_fusiformis.AAC.2